MHIQFCTVEWNILQQRQLKCLLQSRVSDRVGAGGGGGYLDPFGKRTPGTPVRGRDPAGNTLYIRGS